MRHIQAFIILCSLYQLYIIRGPIRLASIMTLYHPRVKWAKTLENQERYYFHSSLTHVLPRSAVHRREVYLIFLTHLFSEFTKSISHEERCKGFLGNFPCICNFPVIAFRYSTRLYRLLRDKPRSTIVLDTFQPICTSKLLIDIFNLPLFHTNHDEPYTPLSYTTLDCTLNWTGRFLPAANPPQNPCSS